MDQYRCCACRKWKENEWVCLEYADDMLLISDNMDVLEMMLQDMHESCSEMGLTISTKKSKLMAVLSSLGADNPQQLPRHVQIQLLSDPVPVVSDFEDLRSIITSDCDMDKEIDSLITRALRCFAGILV